MSSCILDASAILALLLEEDGAGVVADRLVGGLLSTVNLCEVVSFYARNHVAQDDIQDLIDTLPLELIELDAEVAMAAGLMRSITDRAGLSLGDRVCLAHAKLLEKPVVTADKAWSQVAMKLGVELILIR